MGRRPKEELTEDARAASLIAQEGREKELAIDEADRLYLEDGEAYSLNACMERAKIHQGQMAEGMLGLGRQLLLMKAHEEHGQFLAVLDELNLAERSARYAMAAVRKFGNRQSIAVLGSTKIYALTVLDDDDVKSLVEKDELPGVGTLDEIERMTVRELKAALREERERRAKDREAQEAAIAKKEQKLNELETRLRYQEPPTKQQTAQAELDRLRKEWFSNVSLAMGDIAACLATIDKAQKVPDVDVNMLDDFVRTADDIVSSMCAYYEDLTEAMENIRPEKDRK